MKRLSYLFLAVTLMACSDQKLAKRQLSSLSSPGLDFCTTKADTIKSRLKFIFIVDHSGSNQTLGAEIGTDTDGSRRYDPLQRFVTDLPADDSVFFGYINFSTAGTVVQVEPGKEFTNLKDDFADFIWDDNDTPGVPGDDLGEKTGHTVGGSPEDNGWTNYLLALDAANKMIERDIERAIDDYENGLGMVSSSYVVFFVSDGKPLVTVQPGTPEPGQPGVYRQDITDVNNAISEMVNLKDKEQQYENFLDGVQIHTAYYYNDMTTRDDVAAAYMSSMATRGNGLYLEFAGGAVIDFKRFAIPIRISKFDLKEIWVENVNAIWWNGELLRDSDGDGLPDDIEVSLGSNPQVKDSDLNQVGDGVEYQISSGRPCLSLTCQSGAAAQDYTSSCAVPPGGVFGDDDKDYLNDCEEKLLSSNRFDPDSNLDYIPDPLAFKNDIAFLKGTSEALLDPDNDGINNYFELKYNTPLRTNNASVRSLRNTKYIATVLSDNAIQTCYHYDIIDVPTTPQRNDLIRVYLMENRSVAGTKRIMRSGQKRLVGGNVTFTDAEIR